MSCLALQGRQKPLQLQGVPSLHLLHSPLTIAALFPSVLAEPHQATPGCPTEARIRSLGKRTTAQQIVRLTQRLPSSLEVCSARPSTAARGAPKMTFTAVAGGPWACKLAGSNALAVPRSMLLRSTGLAAAAGRDGSSRVGTALLLRCCAAAAGTRQVPSLRRCWGAGNLEPMTRRGVAAMASATEARPLTAQGGESQHKASSQSPRLPPISAWHFR